MTGFVPAGDAALLHASLQGPASPQLSAARGRLEAILLAMTTAVESATSEDWAFWKSEVSSSGNIIVALKDGVAVSGTPEMVHDEGATAALLPEMGSVPAPPVHLRAVDEPGGELVSMCEESGPVLCYL
jgi:hypothetical protein